MLMVASAERISDAEEESIGGIASCSISEL